MNAVQISRDVVLEPADNGRLANLCGQFDEHLRQIERRLNVEIASRGNRFRITGQPGAAEVGGDVLSRLFDMTDEEMRDDYVVPIGKAKIEKQGNDVTVICFSRMVSIALEAADALAAEGIDAEIINLRTIRPIDRETIIQSTIKTGRVVTVEEGWPTHGVGSEICALIMETEV